MSDPLVELILQAKRNKSLYATNEERTKQGIVRPCFARLEWDLEDLLEVDPEYTVGNGRVDYCLKRADEPLVFIEVKRAGEPLDLHQEQLLRYAFDRGVTLAALTDGMRWWLYLPTEPGSWEQRRFFTINFEEQESDDVATHLRNYLAKSNVFSGAALRAAQELHRDRAKERRIREAIPAAWRELCEQPDEQLINLLSDKVEGRCGHRPDPETVEEFIVGTVRDVQHPPTTPPPRPQPVAPRVGGGAPGKQTPGAPTQWTFQRPVAFSFCGQHFHASRFKDILLKLAEFFHDRDPARFWSRVSELQSSRGKSYYTRHPDGLQNPREIGRSGIYVETCFSGNDTRKRCFELLESFGHSKDELAVELRPKNSNSRSDNR